MTKQGRHLHVRAYVSLHMVVQETIDSLNKSTNYMLCHTLSTFCPTTPTAQRSKIRSDVPRRRSGVPRREAFGANAFWNQATWGMVVRMDLQGMRRKLLCFLFRGVRQHINLCVFLFRGDRIDARSPEPSI